MNTNVRYIGLDVHAESIVMAVADAGQHQPDGYCIVQIARLHYEKKNPTSTELELANGSMLRLTPTLGIVAVRQVPNRRITFNATFRSDSSQKP